MKKDIKIYALLISALFFLDRFSKIIMYQNSKKIFNVFSFLQLQLVYNRGISWGMLSFSNELLFWSLTVIIILVILLFSIFTFIRFKNNNNILPELCIITGAFSNVIDRFLYGGVIDFIILHYNSWSWPVFNIADIAIVCGIVSILIMNFFEK